MCLIRTGSKYIHPRNTVIFAKPQHTSHGEGTSSQGASVCSSACWQGQPHRVRKKPRHSRPSDGGGTAVGPGAGWGGTEAHSPTTQIPLNSLSGMMRLLTCAYFEYSRNYTFQLSDLRVKNAGFQLKNVGGSTLFCKIILEGSIQNVLERRKADSTTC